MANKQIGVYFSHFNSDRDEKYTFQKAETVPAIRLNYKNDFAVYSYIFIQPSLVINFNIFTSSIIITSFIKTFASKTK